MHMFFAQHYADNWFNPWNEKWFGGFSQTTFPPLAHQWVAFFARFMSVTLAYMLVQLGAVMLLIVGIFRYARLWVGDRTGRVAAIGSIFLGSLAMMVYQAGDLPATLAAALMINGVVFFYRWVRESSLVSLLAAFFLTVAAGTSEHNTLIFGAPLFALPLMFLAVMNTDKGAQPESERASLFGAVSRTPTFA